MKAVLTYWVIGCIIWGFAMGKILTDCPSTKVTATDALVIQFSCVSGSVSFAMTAVGKIEQAKASMRRGQTVLQHPREKDAASLRRDQSSIGAL